MSSLHQEQEQRTPTFWAAPDLAKAGYPVFPVKNKVPTVPGGFYACTTDHSQIAAWIEEGYGDDDIGVPTGLPSGIAVIEADTQEAYEWMEKHYGPPHVHSRRGGHWYFRHPKDGKVISNKVREGLDRKGDGGLVEVPPSGVKTWTNGIPAISKLPILPEEFKTKRAESTGGDRKLNDERCNEAAEIIALYVAQLGPGDRHEHLKHTCGVLLSHDIAFADAAYTLIKAWTRVGGELADRAPREVENTLRTTEQALAEGRATGVPSMEKLTPGLYEDLKDFLGVPKIRFGRQSKNGSASNASNASDSYSMEDLPEPEKFPVEVFPPVIEAFIREAAGAIGCPVDYIGLSTLAALSGGIGDTRRVVIKNNWTEGASIYGLIVGESATKKTPAINTALRPVRERQGALQAEYERQKEEYESAMRDFKRAPKGGPTELREPKKPVLGRTWVDDTTVERLADILNENRRGICVIKDELSGWLGSMNQYKQGGKGADRQFWLSVHSNQPVSVDRKSAEEPVIVPHPWVSIVGGIQPKVLPDFGSDRGDGLIDRYLAVYPSPYKTRWTDDELSDTTRDRYNHVIKNLYRLRHANDDLDPFPSRVPMTEGAKALFIESYNKLHEELEAPGFPQRLRAPWGKLEAYLARFALILAMASRASVTDPGPREWVTTEDMEGAIRLLEYFKNHARRLYTGLYGANPTDRLAADLREFLIEREGRWEGAFSDLHAALDSEFKPERSEDLGKAVRRIAKRTPGLNLEDLGRKDNYRRVRLSLEIAGTAGTAGSKGGKA